MKKVLNKNNILAFIIPMLIMLSYLLYKSIIIKDFFSNGEEFLVGDASSQYTALYSYIHNVLIGKDSIFYSFYNSLGGNMTSTIGYYLASPFNILYIFVSKSNIPFMTYIIYILKISLCSLFMNIFLNNKYGNKYTNLIFSLSYAFMGFITVYYFNSMWLDVIYMTPLVILGIDRLFDNKPILYIISLTLSIIFNFYMAYMLCIFVIIYFIYKLFIKYSINEIKNYKKVILRFIICSIISLLLSLFFLLPVLLNLKDIIRAPIDYKSLSFKISSFTDFIDLIISKTYIDSNNITSMFGRNRPVIYVSLFTFILSIFYFFNKKIKLKERLLSLGIIIFFLLSFSIPYLQLFWQGFTFPNGYIDRFSYLYSFFIILIASKEYYSKNKQKKYILIVFYLIYLLFAYVSSKESFTFLSNKDIIISVIFVTLYLILYSKYKKIILVLVIIELSFNYFGTIVTTNDMKLEPNYKEYYNKICSITNIDNKYRLESNFNYTLLDSYVCGYHNMTSGISTIDGDLYKFLKSNGQSITYTTIFYNEDSPMILESLLGIKYIFTSKKMENINYKLLNSYTINLSKKDKNVFYDLYLYENKNALSMGYKIEKLFYNKSNDSFDNLNNLVKALSGIDEDVLVKVKLNKKDNNTYEFYNDKIHKEYYLTSDYNITTNYNNYGKLFLNDKEYTIVDSLNIGSIKLEVNKLGKNKLKLKESNSINELYLYYLDEKIYEKAIRKLKENEVKNIKFNGNKLKGNIDLKTDSYIFLSILYDKGWNVYIDNKKVNYKKVADEFIGIKVKKGKHSIYMKYYPKGLFLGAFISISTLIMSIIIFKLKNKYHNN